YRYSAITSGLAESLNNARISIFPNPVAEVLQIEGLAAAKGKTTLKIYDISGKVVLTKEAVTGNQTEMNVANLNKGIYFIEISAGKERAGKQFLKLSASFFYFILLYGRIRFLALFSQANFLFLARKTCS